MEPNAIPTTFQLLIDKAITNNKVVLIQIKLDGLRQGAHFTVINSNGRVADCSSLQLLDNIAKGLEEELDKI